MAKKDITIPKDIELLFREKVIEYKRNKYTGEIIITSGGNKKLLNHEEKQRIKEWFAIDCLQPCTFIDKKERRKR